jgi:hypothetical protein
MAVRKAGSSVCLRAAKWDFQKAAGRETHLVESWASRRADNWAASRGKWTAVSLVGLWVECSEIHLVGLSGCLMAVPTVECWGVLRADNWVSRLAVWKEMWTVGPRVAKRVVRMAA